MIPIADYGERGSRISALNRLHARGSFGSLPPRYGGDIPYWIFLPADSEGRIQVSDELHGAQHAPVYRHRLDFMFAAEDVAPISEIMQTHVPGSLVLRKDEAVVFDASRMKTFWRFDPGNWVPLPGERISIKFDAEAAHDEFVRFLTNMFGDWHFNLSAQERTLDHAKDYVKRRFAERLHKADPVKYPEVPAFRDLPNKVDAEALLSLRKLRTGKPADTATLEQLAWLTECGVRDAMNGADTEDAILAVVEKVTKGVLTAKGFNNPLNRETFWTIREGISPVWQHNIIDRGNAYLAAEARILAGLLNTESHHPAPLAVIEAVAASVGGVVHTRSVR